MVRRQTESRKGWPYLLERASRSDRDARKIAVVRAYSWVEHALEASGLGRKSLRRKSRRCSVAERLLIAHSQGSLRPELTSDVLREAIRVRHEAAHKDTIPSDNVCSEAVVVLRNAWSDLRRAYVTFQHALDLASRIAAVDGVLHVLLFGSLARGDADPGDIDLLALDDGRYSAEIEADESFDYQDTTHIAKHAFRLLHLRDATLKHAAICRWIDLLVFNGKLLGTDAEYTRDISARQSDSHFFLNIARDVRQYLAYPRRFEAATVPVFVSLQQISTNLEILGFAGTGSEAERTTELPEDIVVLQEVSTNLEILEAERTTELPQDARLTHKD